MNDVEKYKPIDLFHEFAAPSYSDLYLYGEYEIVGSCLDEREEEVKTLTQQPLFTFVRQLATGYGLRGHFID